MGSEPEYRVRPAIQVLRAELAVSVLRCRPGDDEAHRANEPGEPHAGATSKCRV